MRRGVEIQGNRKGGFFLFVSFFGYFLCQKQFTWALSLLFMMMGAEYYRAVTEGGINRRRAEEQLFSTYSYFIREGVIKHSLSEDESFDAYSDSILSAIDKILSHSFEGRSTLKTWLFQIFHNKCVDLLRKKATHKRSVFNTLSITGIYTIFLILRNWLYNR